MYPDDEFVNDEPLTLDEVQQYVVLMLRDMAGFLEAGAQHLEDKKEFNKTTIEAHLQICRLRMKGHIDLIDEVLQVL